MIAALAGGCDPRTVRRYLHGETVRVYLRQRIAEALLRLGYETEAK